MWGFKYQDLKKDNYNELKINSENIITIDVPFSKSKKEIRTSKLIDTSYAVRLETTKNNLIGSVDEVKIYDGKIYVLDINKAKAVFVFDFNGKYLGRIGEKGRGPGEYPRPEGFEIDKKNKELLISNASIRKILRYDFKGNFLGAINVKIGNVNFKVLENGNIVLLGGDQGNEHLGELSNRIVYIINRKSEIISYGSTASLDYNNVKMQFLGNLMVQNDEISYSYKFSDTIYNVNSKGINAVYKLDFGDYNLNREELKFKDTYDFHKLINKREKITNLFFR